MSVREFLWIVKESSLGTAMANPSPGADSIYIRLVDGNSFGMTAEPIIEEIPYGGGLAVAAEAVSDHYECKGQLKTKLYPTQAPLLLSLLAARVSSDQTHPWPTDQLSGDLASVSIYHAVQRSDGTYRRKRYAGVKAAGGRIEVSRQGTTATLTLDLQACRSYGNTMDGTSDPTSSEFPAPAESDYPTGPYTFRNTAGRLTVGSVRTQYESLVITIRNALDARWFETSYLTVLQFCGRSSTLDTDLYLKSTPDDRSAYEAITAQACSLALSNGTNTCSINFNGKNHIVKLPYDLPLNRAFMQKLSLKNRFDPEAALDLTVSFT
jgi:hypothetical protein